MRRKSCFCIPPQVSSGIWLPWVGKGLAEAPETAGAVCVGGGGAWLKLPTPAGGHPQAAHPPQMGARPGVLLARWAAGVEGTPCEGNLAGSQGTPRPPQGSLQADFQGLLCLSMSGAKQKCRPCATVKGGGLLQTQTEL